MKITDKVVGRIVDSIREDLAKIAEEQGPRLLKALDEQVRQGGDVSIRLGIDVVLTDKGMAENAVEVQSKFGFVRKVKDEDAYIPHVIDLGETLFERTARIGGKDAAAGDGVPTISVDMDAECAECGKPGRCGNGLCMSCTTKAISGKRMKSAAGQLAAGKAGAK